MIHILWFIVWFNSFFDSPFCDSFHYWRICDCQSWNSICSYLSKGKSPPNRETEMYGSYDPLYGSNLRFMVQATLSWFKLRFHDSSYAFMIRDYSGLPFEAINISSRDLRRRCLDVPVAEPMSERKFNSRASIGQLSNNRHSATCKEL